MILCKYVCIGEQYANKMGDCELNGRHHIRILLALEAMHKGRPHWEGEGGTPKADIVLEVSKGG